MTAAAADPAAAAREFAAVLEQYADDLASTDLDRVSPALGSVRKATRHLQEALGARGWGDDIIFGWTHAPADDDLDGDELGEDGLDGWDDEEDSDPPPPAVGEKFTYQARFDFVVTDPAALERRVRERALEVMPGVDPEQERDYMGGALNFLLYLDNPTFRDYEEAGLHMAYGKENLAPVERTLDEFDFDEQSDRFPVT